MSEQEEEVGKFYTSARKFQQVIGVFSDGTVIPGGPYTQFQVAVAILTLMVVGTTRALNFWHFFILLDIVICVLIAALCGWAVGKLPQSRRSLVKMTGNFVELIGRPVEGRYKGKKLSENFHKRPKMKKALKEEQKPVQRPSAAPSTVPASGLRKLMQDREQSQKTHA